MITKKESFMQVEDKRLSMQRPRLKRFIIAIIAISAFSIFFVAQFLIPPAQQAIANQPLVLFSPDDKPKNHLIKYLNHAQKRIYAAIYMLTDKDIAQTLIDAKNRNIDVQVVFDKASIVSRYGKVKMLLANNVNSLVFKVTKGGWAPLMHNKFAIIDECLWTGSFNWTKSANTKNQENVIYTNEKSVLNKFLAHFEKLKTRCEVILIRQY
jgi:phosphatidylserine/phosphatidylglycerophosphate/cardiolipin synthase-like enzyme